MEQASDPEVRKGRQLEAIGYFRSDSPYRDMTEMPTHTIGIAVVGYGYWGPKLARNFIQDGSFNSVVICEDDPTRLERALRENPRGAAGEKLQGCPSRPHDRRHCARHAGGHALRPRIGSPERGQARACREAPCDVVGRSRETRGGRAQGKQGAHGRPHL